MNAEELFLAALERQTAAERKAFLDGVCAQDPNLRQQVEELLQSHEAAGSFLDAPLFDGGETTPQSSSEAVGARIGPYKLLQEIGQGGMGTVYMAEQHEPVRRKVALKVIKQGMDTRQVIARFEAERQALALMDHPNIARVLDGGTTGNGRPYFVMELVKGQPITEYCDQHQLALRQRLELLVPVCQAIQHAHQKGIIHRDIKPSNILVAEYDQQVVPKVIDFGVAKAVSQPLTEGTLFTAYGQIVGTLEYMSPEQAKVNQLDVDTRSDVYSLGVLLYELLTGLTPFDKQRLRAAAWDEMLRIIREEEPPHPSTRLSNSKESLPSISAQRRSEPAKLTRSLQGELDWIVMKALEKDRSRRYETATGLAADLQRYLNDEPILARPPSTGYRLRKFARRNMTAVVTTAVLAVMLLAIVAGAGWTIRDRAAREAEAAREHSDRIARASTHIESILGEARLSIAARRWSDALAVAQRAQSALAVGEVGEEATEQVRALLRDLELVIQLEAIPADAESSITSLNSRYEEAFRDYGVNIATDPINTTAEKLGARADLRVPIAAALDDWAMTLRRQLQRSQDSSAPAASWQHVVQLAGLLDPDPLRNKIRATWDENASPETVEALRAMAYSSTIIQEGPVTLNLLGRSLWVALGSDESVLEVFRKSVQAHPDNFYLNLSLGWQLTMRGKHREALRYYTAATAIRPEEAVGWSYLGGGLRNDGRSEEAIRCYQEAISLQPRNARYHTLLGLTMLVAEKFREAEASCRKAVELAPDSTHAHLGLGLVMFEQGGLDEAIASFRHVLTFKPDSVKALTYLGNAYAKQEMLDEAVAHYHRAIEYASQKGGISHSDLALAHLNLGVVLRQRGDIEQSLESLQRAVELTPSGSSVASWAAREISGVETELAMSRRLAAISNGSEQPENDEERLVLATFAHRRKMFACAAQLLSEAIRENSSLAEDRQAQHRYNAACAAALAGCGFDEGNVVLSDTRRAAFREEALHWLRDELATWNALHATEAPEQRELLCRTLRHWQSDPDLRGIREPHLLATLDSDERLRFEQLWQDVGMLLARVDRSAN